MNASSLPLLRFNLAGDNSKVILLVASLAIASCKPTYRAEEGFVKSEKAAAEAAASTSTSASTVESSLIVSNQTGTWGTAFSYTPTNTGGTITNCAIASGNLPSTLSINATTCAITGTPYAAFTANNSFTITATNSSGTATTSAFTITVPAPSLTYNSTVTSYPINSAIAQNTPSISDFSGTPSYSVNPALPAGMSINSLSGVISGTPTAITASANYVVTVVDLDVPIPLSNTIDTETLTITVTDVAPSLTIANQSGTWGTAFSYTPGNSGGLITSCALASGTLPSTLSLNTVTCAITGTPAAALTSSNSYTVTATNTGGSSTSAAFTITIPVPALTYSSTSMTATKNSAIAANTVSIANFSGTPAYSVSPALPAGLSIHATTGAISGTPTAATASATYTVTARDSSNADNSTNTLDTESITIVVNDVAPSLAVSNQTGTWGTAFSYTPTNNGGAITSCALTSGTLPSTLSLNTSTCAITGTPAASLIASNSYTVTATNITGSSTSAAFTITIPVPVLTYDSTNVDYTKNSAITANTVALAGFSGTPAYSVSPALPAGLSLNASTGAISGTPTTATASANYTITARDSSNADNNTNTLDTEVIDITILDVAATLTISAPNSGNNLATATASQTVSGICSTNATNLTATDDGVALTFSDSNCSDGTWALDARTYSLGANAIVVNAENLSGVPVSDSMTITYELPPALAITTNNSAGFTQNIPALILTGTCATTVATMTANVGTFSDDDCSDGTWTLPYTLTNQITSTISVTGTTAAGSSTTKSISVTYCQSTNAAGTTNNTYSGGAGTAASPYLITTVAGLNDIRNNLAAYYRIDANIDMKCIDWTPIANTFTGTIDGNGRTISNFYYNNSGASQVGFISVMASGTIKNLTFADATVIGSNDVGGLIGTNSFTTSPLSITDVSFSGKVVGNLSVGLIVGSIGMVPGGTKITRVSSAGTVTATGTAGGIGGQVNATVRDSYSTANVSATGDVGGVFGTIGVGPVTGSYATGTVTNTSTAGSEYTGGFCGNCGSTILIGNSYATGAVTAAAGAVGGFGGKATSNTMNAIYATGTAYSSHNASYVGGLFGELSGVTLSKSWATGTATGSYTTGGLAGFIDTSTVSNSYARGNVSGANTGGFSGEISGGTMTNNYSTGTVTGSGNKGDFLGLATAAPIMQYAYALSGLVNLVGSGALHGTSTGNAQATAANLKKAVTFAGYSFVTGWNIVEDTSYPTLLLQPVFDVSSQTGTWGVAFSYVPTNLGATLTSCSLASGTLPAALTLNTTTCEITGTPASAFTAANLTVTGTNTSGNATSAAFDISVSQPDMLYLSTSETYTQNFPINPNSIIFISNWTTGTTATYTANPPLPPGLNLDINTGLITGIPFLTQPPIPHVITMLDASNNVVDTEIIWITINP